MISPTLPNTWVILGAPKKYGWNLLGDYKCLVKKSDSRLYCTGSDFLGSLIETLYYRLSELYSFLICEICFQHHHLGHPWRNFVFRKLIPRFPQVAAVHLPAVAGDAREVRFKGSGRTPWGGRQPTCILVSENRFGSSVKEDTTEWLSQTHTQLDSFLWNMYLLDS